MIRITSTGLVHLGRCYSQDAERSLSADVEDQLCALGHAVPVEASPPTKRKPKAPAEAPAEAVKPAEG